MFENFENIFLQKTSKRLLYRYYLTMAIIWNTKFLSCSFFQLPHADLLIF